MKNTKINSFQTQNKVDLSSTKYGKYFEKLENSEELKQYYSDAHFFEELEEAVDNYFENTSTEQIIQNLKS